MNDTKQVKPKKDIAEQGEVFTTQTDGANE
jgi:hypothetical protein